MHDAADGVLYVGKAKSLRHRLGSYRIANPERMKRRTLRLLRLVRRIAWEECLDEPASLIRESELLKSLRPKFNRAGVWETPDNYLVWRHDGPKVEICIADVPRTGWEAFGPCGSGIRFFRASLVRLLWYGTNAPASCAAMPEGWISSRIGRSATVVDQKTDTEDCLDALLSRLLTHNDVDRFAAWITERTSHLIKSCDLEIRDSDLETVAKFIATKTRRVATSRTLPVNIRNLRTNSTPFLRGADWDEL